MCVRGVTVLLRKQFFIALLFQILFSAVFIGALYMLSIELTGILLFLLALLLLLVYSLLNVHILLEPQRDSIQKLKHYADEVLHEINVPVATILSNCEMIHKSCSETNIRRLQRIEASAKRLQSLYQQMEYEVSHQIKRTERVGVDELLNEMVDEFKSVHKSRIFILDLERLDAKLDRIGFMSAISNLIDNAIKYSDVDSTISVTLEEAALSITDAGKGMDALQLLKIFDAYYQESRLNQGYGLGLSVVKRFCDESNIALRVNSEPGEGTTFILDLKEVAYAK